MYYVYYITYIKQDTNFNLIAIYLTIMHYRIDYTLP